MFFHRVFSLVKKYSHIINDIKWSLVSIGFLQGGNFIISIVIARIIGKEYFGLFGTIISTATMIVGVAGAGLSIAATKFIAERDSYISDKINRIIGLCQLITLITAVVYSMLLLIFSEPLSSFFLKDSARKELFIISIPYVFFMVLNLYQTGVLQGFRSFKKISINNGIYFLCSIVSVVIFGYLFGIKGVIISFGLSAFINWCLFRHLLIRKMNSFNIIPTWSKIKSEVAVIKYFFIPALLSGIVGSLGPWLSNMILVSGQSGYDEVAIFTATNSYKSFIVLIPSLLSKVYAPLICESRKFKPKLYVKYFYQNIFLSLIVALIMAIVIVLFYPTLLLLFGQDFIAPLGLILWLCLSAILDVFISGLYQLLYSQGKMKYQFYISLVWSLCLIISSYYFTSILGATGLAIAYCFASATSVIIYLFLFMFKKINLHV